MPIQIPVAGDYVTLHYNGKRPGRVLSLYQDNHQYLVKVTFWFDAFTGHMTISLPVTEVTYIPKPVGVNIPMEDFSADN